MLDQLRPLAVFAKTAELGSFRAAARALSLSPSVVSYHVSELERRLALPLIYRTTRRLSLTADGEKLFAEAQQMVDAAERGLDVLSGRSQSITGSLRLTAPAFLAETAFCTDLAAFSTAHPNVTLTTSFADARSDLLRDGLDVALRIGRLESSTHKVRKLADMHRLLVASTSYAGARPKPRAPKDLASWSYIQLSSRPAEIVLTRARETKPSSISFSPRMSADSATAVRTLALAGAGLATLPEAFVRPEIERGNLVEVLPGWRLPLLPVFAVWPNSTRRAALTHRFLDFMSSRVAALFGLPSNR